LIQAAFGQLAVLRDGRAVGYGILQWDHSHLQWSFRMGDGRIGQSRFDAI
jgi:hypothetical protein